uniref:Reverse transcriptase domain-containing protein n=1 Tax=Lactuca sativa TaxID=4236 RepID=A0A9R1X4B1_LACSA|nr:hypothetical protein LSAT_V11C600306310 [Lactuca sativa]
MGFGNRWRFWIRGSLASSRAFVLINGVPTKEFPITKGVRQGDLLSPFLFIIAMEGLNVAIRSAIQNSLYSGISLPNNGPSISHLFYADDVLFVGDCSLSNFKNLSRILKCFHVVSGLNVNFHKSKVYGIGIENSDVVSCANIMGCEAANLPFVYLGVPVGANKNLKRNWKPVIDKVQGKLSSWKSKTLSFGGKLTLVKSAPNSVIGLLEKIRRRFLWGGTDEKIKICWVAWKHVLADKESGGLGVGSLKSLNIALLCKWIWRFKSENSSLWKQAKCGIHNLSRKPIYNLSKRSIPGVWNNLVSISKILGEMGLDFYHFISTKIGSGRNTLFWLDNWIGDGNLALRFPNLYALDKRKSCFLAERFSSNGFLWAWRKNPSLPVEMAELAQLCRLLDGVSLSSDPDSWKSKLSSDGQFYVSDICKLIDSKVTVGTNSTTVWVNLVPLKIICFVWRASLDGIPSSMALSRRGVGVTSTRCLFCINGVDDTDHLLIACDLAKEVFKWIFKWCDVPFVPFSSVSEALNFAAKWGNCPKKRKVFLAILYGGLWSIWKGRNDMLFNQVPTTISKVVDNIITMVFGWVKHRGNFGNCNWANWCCSPFSVL